MQDKGLFISLEGIDGAGKSTHVTFIKEHLENLGYQVSIVREPGGTECGELIRDLLLHKPVGMHRMTELFLLLASRQELISNVIMPSLEKGMCVIADRFIDSTFAYQGGGRHIGVDKVKLALSLLEPEVKPNLTFIFDVDLETATKRLQKNAKQDRIESESRAFFAMVQNTYHDIVKAEPNRAKLLNTLKTKEENRAIIVEHLQQLCSAKK